MKIKAGLHQFSTSQFGTLPDWMAATNAERDTLLVACSDHGTAPDNLSFAGESRLLILPAPSHNIRHFCVRELGAMSKVNPALSIRVSKELGSILRWLIYSLLHAPFLSDLTV